MTTAAQKDYRYIRRPVELETLEDRDDLSMEEILRVIRGFIPGGGVCRPGCHECCGPVPFSEYEWSRVPQVHKEGLMLKRLPLASIQTGEVKLFDNHHVIIPFKAGTVPQKILRHYTSLGATMRLGPKMAVDCPFVSPAGCKIYPERPIVCRLFAASEYPVLRCTHGVSAPNPLNAYYTSISLGYGSNAARMGQGG